MDESPSNLTFLKIYDIINYKNERSIHMTVEDIKKLREQTGCSLRDCKEAFEYAESHKGCTPLGYLKAKTLAVRIEPFERKVRVFSE
jgi:hypothetical protein